MKLRGRGIEGVEERNERRRDEEGLWRCRRNASDLGKWKKTENMLGYTTVNLANWNQQATIITEYNCIGEREVK